VIKRLEREQMGKWTLLYEAELLGVFESAWASHSGLESTKRFPQFSQGPTAVPSEESLFSRCSGPP